MKRGIKPSLGAFQAVPLSQLAVLRGGNTGGTSGTNGKGGGGEAGGGTKPPDWE